MANITQIRIRIRTGSKPNSGTDGHVYFAICGREFHLDSRETSNDFELGSNRTYRLGTDPNIHDESFNDPRDPQLNTDDLNRFPVWVRFEPVGNSPDWNLEEVELTVISTAPPITYNAAFLTGGPDLWLGQRIGKFCFLRRV